MAGPWERYADEEGPWTQYDRRQRPDVMAGSVMNPPSVFGKEGIQRAIAEDYRKAPWLDRQLIGAGTAASNAYEGVKQWAGKGDTPQIEANRTIASENPGAAFAGNVGMFALTAMIPGANTVTGSALIGGLAGAAQPVLGDESRTLNTGIGAGAGYLGKKIGDGISGAVTNQETSEAARQGRNAIKDATLRQSQEAGYVLPKSEVSPGFLSNRLEGLAGKAALKQDATLRNQETTNALGRKVIGLADDQPISPTAIASFGKATAEPYRQVAALDKRAAAALELLKDTRAEAKVQWNFYNRSATPEAMRLAKALDQKAVTLEKAIDKIAQNNGQPDLVTALREARTKIAQSHDLERALNTSTGDVEARVLGTLLDKGKPLSGELKTIGDFSQAYPKFSGSGVTAPAPGVGKTEHLAAALLGAGGSTMAGPAGMTAAGLAYLSQPTRAMLLSQLYQGGVKPSYGPGRSALLARALAPQLPVAATQGALEPLR